MCFELKPLRNASVSPCQQIVCSLLQLASSDLMSDASKEGGDDDCRSIFRVFHSRVSVPARKPTCRVTGKLPELSAHRAVTGRGSRTRNISGGHQIQSLVNTTLSTEQPPPLPSHKYFNRLNGNESRA